ncbi:MAG: ATP-binding protein [Chthoniobacteraceae bacterium]
MKNTLALQTGRIQRPQKAVIYGPEGIGKSTLASQFPSPVFLDTEGGSHHLDIVRLLAPKSWEEVTSAITALGSEAHDFRTFVIDTADWLEKLLIEHICQRSNKTSIEDFGYGKGYTLLAEKFTKLLASLDPLLACGMHVLLLAHCRIVKFEQPEAAEAYDRYELKLTKQVAPLVKEWCDMQLFANYFTRVAESDSGKKRDVGGRERVLYTNHTAAGDAKNRHGFEEKLHFAFASIATAFGCELGAPAAPRQEQTPFDKIAELFGGNEDAVNAFLLSRSQIKQGQPWRDLSPDYKDRVFSAPDRFMQTVAQFRQEVAAK